MTDTHTKLKESELGKKSNYHDSYSPEKLFPLDRQLNREELGIQRGQLPFYGFDIWNHYEISWLDNKGKPQVAIAEFVLACDTPNIIESKSLKLYFNSLNNTSFKNLETLEATVKKDLEEKAQAEVILNIYPLNAFNNLSLHTSLQGTCIDHLDVECTEYQTNPHYLKTEENEISETVYSDLLRSNCPITNQPDWGSVAISYKGKKINHEGLLKYIVSLRNHNEFHEHCIERIFTDIMKYCKPTELTVYGRYTRRGGLDINPIRSTKPISFTENKRLCRQ